MENNKTKIVFKQVSERIVTAQPMVTKTKAASAPKDPFVVVIKKAVSQLTSAPSLTPRNSVKLVCASSKNDGFSERSTASKSPVSNLKMSIPSVRKVVPVLAKPTSSLPVLKHFGELVLSSTILGKGAFAVVRKAVHSRTGVEIACKTYPLNKIQTPLQVLSLKSEVDILSKMKHPGIARFLGRFDAGIHVHLLMELCGNHNLQTFLQKHPEAWPNPSETKTLFRKLTEIVAYLHKQNVAHRDLKLGNICFWDIQNPKLVDFGLARVGAHLNFDEQAGTAYYMSPETVRRAKNKQAAKADVWALGVILFYLLNKSYPFDAETEQSLYQKILTSCPDFSGVNDKSAVDLLVRLLHKQQEHRLSCEDILKHPYLSNPHDS